MMTGIRILLLSREKFVRTFNLLWLVSISLLIGKENQFKIHSLLKDDVQDSLVAVIQQDPNPSIELNLESFSIQPDWAHYIKLDHQKKIDTLIVMATEEIKQPILNQIGSPLENTSIGQPFSKVSQTIHQRYYFLNREPIVDIGLVRADFLGAIIRLDPEFESHFSGIFGMGKRGQSWAVTGQIDLHLENLFQTAGFYELYWQRVDSLSQVIRFKVDEPHPFGWEVGGQWNYHHEVIKGLYSVIENQTLLQMYLPGLHLVNLGYSAGKTIPTGAGEKNGYETIGFKAFSFSSRRDSRNDRFFPNKGMMLFGSVDIGLQEGTGFMEGELELNYFHPIRHNFHGYLKYIGKGIRDFNHKVPKSRYYLFGGTSTLRGYTEQQFSATQYHISSLEIAYQPNSAFQVDLFIDYGLTSIGNYMDGHTGVGFGLSQKTDQSIVKVQYALPYGNALTQGKLHFKWISRL